MKFLTYCYLAAVLLKQFIKKHWRENEEAFEYPLVSSEEKVLSLSSFIVCFGFPAEIV